MIASSFAAGSHLGPIHGCLVAVAVVVMAAGDARGAWTENFDNYANGSTILTQGDWVGWHQVGTEDTIVDDAQAASAPHSLVMGGPAVVDLVPQFSGATSGTWYLDVMTYVPGTSNSKSSDIGFLARHTGFQGAPNTQWFGPFTLNMETGMVNGALPIIRDQWVPMHTVFDFDARTYDIFYNGELAKSGSFPDAWDSAVVGLDPWTPAGASPLYYDDFRMASTIFVPREAPSLTITGIADDLVFTWDSSDGQKYNLRSETGLSTDPATWPVFDGNGDLGATPPENTLTIPRPADAERFFVIEEFLAPPVPIFEEYFDTTPAGSLPTGWTLGGSPGDVPGTNWELGAPSIVGPPTAFDGLNCVGTNIAAPYTLNANIFLRSPMIDLVNATGATLNFAHWVDIEADFDFGSVAVLDATDNSELGLVVNVVDGDLPSDWTQFSRSVPAAALGKNVIFEFRFFEDGISLLDQAGWYIDNVVVTVPGS